MNLSRGDSKRFGKASELANVLQAATEQVDELLTLLADEREALENGNIEVIEHCGKKKADCVIQLETLDNQRAHLCRQLDLDNTEIDQYLSQQHATSSQHLWESFLVKLENCRDANSVNGSFARIRRGHIEKALHILRGSPDSTGLYGPNGLDENNNVTHLGRA